MNPSRRPAPISRPTEIAASLSAWLIGSAIYCALLIGTALWLQTSLPSGDLLRALLALLIYAVSSVAGIIAALLSGRASGANRLYAGLAFCAFITVTRPELIFQIIARAEPVVAVYRASVFLPSMAFARIYHITQRSTGWPIKNLEFK